MAENNTQYIYQDRKTGNQYIFDGEKLVQVGKASKPQIGKPGNKDFLDKENEERRKQVEKEMAEAGEKEETEEEKEARLQKIKDIFNDPNEKDKVLKSAKDAINREIRDKIQKERKAKEEADRYKTQGGLKDFTVDLENFISNEIEEAKELTWNKPNMSYEGSDILKKGYGNSEMVSIPSVYMYFDVSSSWGSSDIEMGKKAISELNYYVDRGELELKLKYFANEIGDTVASAQRNGSGTGAGAKLIQDIVDYQPDNVIVMTDDDIGDGGGWHEIDDAPNITVPGGVWFLFKYGSVSKELVQHLRGEKETALYNLNK